MGLDQNVNCSYKEELMGLNTDIIFITSHLFISFDVDLDISFIVWFLACRLQLNFHMS